MLPLRKHPLSILLSTIDANIAIVSGVSSRVDSAAREASTALMSS